MKIVNGFLVEDGKIYYLPPSNYYGQLQIKSQSFSFYCMLEDRNTEDWVEIPEYVFDALIRYFFDLQSKEVNNG